MSGRFFQCSNQDKRMNPSNLFQHLKKKRIQVLVSTNNHLKKTTKETMAEMTDKSLLVTSIEANNNQNSKRTGEEVIRELKEELERTKY